MAIELRELTLEGLADLKGGLVNRMFAQAINRIAIDCESAPDIADWRKATITVRAKPVIEDGELGEVILEFDVGHKTPSRVTSCRVEVKKNNRGAKTLFFNVDAPDNPQQHTLLPTKESEVKLAD